MKNVHAEKENTVARTQAIAQQAGTEGISLPAVPVYQRKENQTGLPDGLKAGIEQLSGFSMKEVRVHYNSAKPAQLQAHAYAQGSDIHVASGQEKHLPHEAWHVVQQKQGRVQPTVQLQEAAVNDNPELEKEADTMGEQAVRLSTAAAPDAPDAALKHTAVSGEQNVQRKITAHVNTEDIYKDAYNNFLGALDTAVTKAYMYALHYPLLNSFADLDGHTQHWVECWNGYVGGTFTNLSLLKAAFGYVVESLATMIYLPQPAGDLSVELQGIRGATRPDVVLKHNGKDIGWLDITAENSEGHIWNKAGWESKSIHVGEVAYPSLNPELIKDNLLNNRQYDDNTNPEEVMERVRYFKFMQEARRYHWATIGERYFSEPLDSSNQTLKRKYIRLRVADYLGLPYNELPPQVLGSVLYAMNVGTEKHGYKEKTAIKNKSRALGESILQEHDRELPMLEGYTPSIGHMLQSEEEEAVVVAQIRKQVEEHSGTKGFTTITDESTLMSLPDESGSGTGTELIELGRDSGNQVMRIHTHVAKYIGQTIRIDPDSIGELYRMMNRQVKTFRLSKVAIAVQLGNGSIISGVVDRHSFARVKMIHTLAKDKKERREKLLWNNRRKYMPQSSQSMTIPPSLPALSFGPIQISSDIVEYLSQFPDAQIVAIGYETEEGLQSFVGQSTVFSGGFLE